MGVRGLKSFLDREGQIYPVNIKNEVEKWKRENSGKTPKIIIDLLSLTHCVARKENDTICGGRHQVTLKAWTDILNALKSTGCVLVFFADLTLQEGKTEEWLSRRNEKFDFYKSVYELINIGAGIASINATVKEHKGLTTKFYGMEVLAQSIGEFHHSVTYECDLEIAQYAKKQNALAVITNDSDFLIFDGTWKLWSSDDIEITASKEVKTLELNRKALANICSLSSDQLPLFATIMGNDFTKGSYDQLNAFHRTLGPMKNKIQNIAKHVRNVNKNGKLSDSDIKKIASNLFGSASVEKQKLIRQSVDSYNTDFPPPTVDDPLERKLLKTKVYRPYMTAMSTNQGITMPFYDMKGGQPGANFPMLLASWLKRRIGVIRKHNNDDVFTFTLLMKKSINEYYQEYTESPIYPEFSVPALEKLYVENEGQDDKDIAETRWKIFAFIMSFPDKVISALNELPKNYLLIGTTLYALVKNGLMGAEEADGILYTEYKNYANEIKNIEYPSALKAKYVRAAQLYNDAFAAVRANFAIAGLLPCIEDVMQFDGIYYQKLMEKVSKMVDVERDTYFGAVNSYRIYSKSL